MQKEAAINALEAAIRRDLWAEVRAEVRAELEAEISAERLLLGKRLLTKRQVWSKLGISEDTLDELRRSDHLFPKPKKLQSRLQWREHEVDGYIDQP